MFLNVQKSYTGVLPIVEFGVTIGMQNESPPKYALSFSDWMTGQNPGCGVAWRPQFYLSGTLTLLHFTKSNIVDIYYILD